MLSTREAGKAGSPPPGAKPTGAADEMATGVTLAPLASEVAQPESVPARRGPAAWDREMKPANVAEP